MTVKELMEFLEKHPDDLEVVVKCQRRVVEQIVCGVSLHFEVSRKC